MFTSDDFTHQEQRAGCRSMEKCTDVRTSSEEPESCFFSLSLSFFDAVVDCSLAGDACSFGFDVSGFFD